MEKEVATFGTVAVKPPYPCKKKQLSSILGGCFIGYVIGAGEGI